MSGGRQGVADYRQVELNFRLVRGAAGPSQGVALCMPNLRGAAVAGVYAKSNVLPQYDLWACDADIAFSPTDWDDHFWPVIAQVIAERIMQGTAPQPAVLVGYSVGGYVAWLVGRMLSDRPNAPRAVIALDTFPLHYSARARVPALLDLLASIPPLPIPMLDVRRVPPGPYKISVLSERRWDHDDARLLTVPVATLEHDDIIQPPVLVQLAPIIQDYVTSGNIEIPIDLLIECPESIGGAVWSLLHAGRPPDIVKLKEFLADDSTLENPTPAHCLLFLALTYVSLEEASRYCEKLQRRYPFKAHLHYARLVLARYVREQSSRPATGSAMVPLPPDIRLPTLQAYELALHLRDGSFRLSRLRHNLLRAEANLRGIGGALMNYKAVRQRIEDAVLSVVRTVNEKLLSVRRRD